MRYGRLLALVLMFACIFAGPCLAAQMSRNLEMLLSGQDASGQYATIIKDHPELLKQTFSDGSTLLERAIDESYDHVELLINAGVDVNAHDANGGTALMHAAARGNEKMFVLLLRKGADINEKGKDGKMPLTEAIAEGATGFIQVLVAQGADLKTRGPHGYTPLRIAVDRGLGKELAQALLDKGASYGNAFFDAIARDNLPEIKRRVAANPLLVNRKFAGLLPLDQAAFWLHRDIAEWLLSHGANVNARNEQGQTPLVRVLSELSYNQNDNGLIEVLLKHHARTDLAQTNSEPPLWLAATSVGFDDKGFERLLTAFLSHGANVNITYGGTTVLSQVTVDNAVQIGPALLRHHGSYLNPFLDSVAHNDFAAVEKMLKKNPKLVSSTDDNGNQPLRVAEFFGHISIMSLLLNHGAKINDPINAEGSIKNLLLIAVESQDPTMTSFLLTHGADPNLKQVEVAETPIEVALSKNNYVMTKLLLSHHAKLPMDALMRTDSPAMGRLLIADGADVNAKVTGVVDSDCPLSRVIQGFNSRPYALFLRSHGAHDIDPLMDAIAHGDLPKIKEIVAQDPHSLSSHGEQLPPLDVALYWGNKDVVSLLLDLGADPNATSLWGSPLDWLLRVPGEMPNNYVELASLLISKGADVNDGGDLVHDGSYPLSLAVMRGNPDLVSLLLSHGANVHATSTDGQTPLFLVWDKQIATMLLDSGVDVNARDDRGTTALQCCIDGSKDPFELAKSKIEFKGIIELLRKRGATD